MNRRLLLQAAATVPWFCMRRREIDVRAASEPKRYAVLWRRLDRPGMEQCRVIEEPHRVSLEGGLVMPEGSIPWRIEYEIRCDGAWNTREVDIRARPGSEGRTVALRVDERQRWRVNGEERTDLRGCTDVDLGFSPSTNTLPIRRLRLDVTRDTTINAAWVEFPSLTVRRVAQRYTRVAEHRYRYENLPTGFRTELDLDENGLIAVYPPGWEQIAGATHSWEGPFLSAAPAAELGEAAELYAGLIGSWDVDMIDFGDDGSRRQTRGEWHFRWSLEGRAVQDVFIVPARGARVNAAKQGNRFGTTIRFYDVATGAWRITWFNPVTGAVNHLTARKEGDRIVHEGMDADGSLIRWSFLEIACAHLHWIGERSTDAGATWQMQAELFGRRTS